MTREQAISQSRKTLAAMGFDVSEYKSVAKFRLKREEINFLERNIGLKQANKLFRKTIAVWRWKIRWFKELEEVEYIVEFTPEGRFVRYNRTISETKEGLTPDLDKAQSLAENFLTNSTDIVPDQYEFIERKEYDKPNRLDQKFVWRLKDFQISDSEYRVSITLQGDKVGAFGQWLEIPEQWERATKELASKRLVLSYVSLFFMGLLAPAMLIVFFKRTYNHDIRWKATFIVSIIAVIIVLLKEINEIPLVYSSYDTTLSESTFWLKKISLLVLGLVAAFAGVLFTFASSDALGRSFYKNRSSSEYVFNKTFLHSGNAKIQVFMGYGLAFAFLGYVTLFYVIGQRYFGAWLPIEVNINNTFSSYFPSLQAIYIGFMASLNEELIFRLFSIALLLKLTKNPWLSIILPAAVWAFGHTGYPQEPIWIRGFELTIAGIVFGLIFLRFGLLTTLTAHFEFNCFLGVWPLIVSGKPGFIFNSLLALSLPIIFIFVIRWIKNPFAKRKRQNAPLVKKEKPLIATDKPSFVGQPALENIPIGQTHSRRFILIFLLVSILVCLLGYFSPQLDFFGDPPDIRLTKQEGKKACEEVLRQFGGDPAGYRSFTDFYFVQNKLPKYATIEFGPDLVFDKYKEYYGYAPAWYTVWYKEKEIKTLQAYYFEDEKVQSFWFILPDDQPGAMIEEEAAKIIAINFFQEQGLDEYKTWDLIETKKKVKPDRWDWHFTYRDPEFDFGQLEKRARIGLAGDRVISLGKQKFKVPNDWKRERKIQKESLRNTVRKTIANILTAGIVIAFFILFILLLIKRAVKLQDLKTAGVAITLFGIVPWVLKAINNLPAIYLKYPENTEKSLQVYVFEKLVTIPFEIMAFTLFGFLTALLTLMILRHWAPEMNGWKGLLRNIHVEKWGSTLNIQAIFLAIGTAIFLAGYKSLIKSITLIVYPPLYKVSMQKLNISINQLSESLRIVGEIPETFFELVFFLAFAILIRKFIKKEIYVFLGIFIYVIVFTAQNSHSTGEMFSRWGLSLPYFLCCTSLLPGFFDGISWLTLYYPGY